MTDNLSPQQFGDYSIEYAGHDRKGGSMGFHQVVAKDAGGEPVGRLLWRTGSRRPGEIHDLKVTEDHRRKGVATAMYNYAADSGIRPAPKHSRERTDDGEAWAKAVGGPRPRRDSGRIS